MAFFISFRRLGIEFLQQSSSGGEQTWYIVTQTPKQPQVTIKGSCCISLAASDVEVHTHIKTWYGSFFHTLSLEVYIPHLSAEARSIYLATHLIIWTSWCGITNTYIIQWTRRNLQPLLLYIGGATFVKRMLIQIWIKFIKLVHHYRYHCNWYLVILYKLSLFWTWSDVLYTKLLNICEFWYDYL